MGRKNNLEVRTVIFVEQTKGGELAKRTRDILSRLQEMMGFKMKVAERGGTTLKELFPLNNLWDGAKCEREDCPPCNQGTEEQQNCFKRNLVYESICLLCNPGAGSKGLLKEQNTEVPSIYVGETSRSLYERSREHWDLFEKGSTDSHIWKHHWLHHQGAGRPKMIFKVVKYYRTALSRQVGEAIQIRARGGEGEILNSKGEFNRCSITRLVLDKEEQGANTNAEVEIDDEEQAGIAGKDGEQSILRRREQKDREEGRKLGKVTQRMGAVKRSQEPSREQQKAQKKRKFALIGEEWGAVKGAEKTSLNCLLEDIRSKQKEELKNLEPEIMRGELRGWRKLLKTQLRII